MGLLDFVKTKKTQPTDDKTQNTNVFQGLNSTSLPPAPPVFNQLNPQLGDFDPNINPFTGQPIEENNDMFKNLGETNNNLPQKEVNQTNGAFPVSGAFANIANLMTEDEKKNSQPVSSLDSANNATTLNTDLNSTISPLVPTGGAITNNEGENFNKPLNLPDLSSILNDISNLGSINKTVTSVPSMPDVSKSPVAEIPTSIPEENSAKTLETNEDTNAAEFKMADIDLSFLNNIGNLEPTNVENQTNEALADSNALPAESNVDLLQSTPEKSLAENVSTEFAQIENPEDFSNPSTEMQSPDVSNQAEIVGSTNENQNTDVSNQAEIVGGTNENQNTDVSNQLGTVGSPDERPNTDTLLAQSVGISEQGNLMGNTVPEATSTLNLDENISDDTLNQISLNALANLPSSAVTLSDQIENIEMPKLDENINNVVIDNTASEKESKIKFDKVRKLDYVAIIGKVTPEKYEIIKNIKTVFDPNFIFSSHDSALKDDPKNYFLSFSNSEERKDFFQARVVNSDNTYTIMNFINQNAKIVVFFDISQNLEFELLLNYAKSSSNILIHSDLEEKLKSLENIFSLNLFSNSKLYIFENFEQVENYILSVSDEDLIKSPIFL